MLNANGDLAAIFERFVIQIVQSMVMLQFLVIFQLLRDPNCSIYILSASQICDSV